MIHISCLHKFSVARIFGMVFLRPGKEKKMYWYVMICFICMFCLLDVSWNVAVLSISLDPLSCFSTERLPQLCFCTFNSVHNNSLYSHVKKKQTTCSHERGTPTLAMVSWNLKSGSKVSGSSGENWASDRKLVAWTKNKKRQYLFLISSLIWARSAKLELTNKKPNLLLFSSISKSGPPAAFLQTCACRS